MVYRLYKNLQSGFEQHNAGKVKSTKHRRPFELIYFEACLNQKDALHREKYLKTHMAKCLLRNGSNHISQGKKRIKISSI